MHHDQASERASLHHKRELLVRQLDDLEVQAERFARRSTPLLLTQRLRQVRDELARVEAELATLDAQ